MIFDNTNSLIVFISCARLDNDFARWVADGLLKVGIIPIMKNIEPLVRSLPMALFFYIGIIPI
ncbi:toll/interleukin-1 receptor domain-containing protein [Draconibacterium sp.]|nr:toll/interleukin-1 receptor domain-containing protein [Draconibacterium sp.]